MKKLKYLLFIFVLFLTPTVFADTTYDMTSRITSPVNYTECGSGSYTGVELNGSTNCWNTNVRYQGTLRRVYFNLPAPSGNVFESDTSYRLSLYMATNDWRNNFGSVSVKPGSSYTNNFVDTFTFVSKKQVNITFTVPYAASTTYQTLWVDLPSTDSNTLITGETNWNLSKVTLTKLTSGSGGSSGGGSSSATNQDVINNANDNTQDIIDNNNTNTQDIINNNNSNTQDIIKSGQSCFTSNDNIPLSLKQGYELTSNGFRPNSSWEVSSYIPIYEGITYNSAGWSSNYYCVYDINFNIRQCSSNNSYIAKSGDAFIVRNTTISGANNPRMWGYGDYCISKTDIENRQNALNSKNQQDKTQDINDSINNSNVDNDVGTGFFDDFTSQDFGLSQIITIPLNTIQSLTSKTCVPLEVPIPFTNSNISLPCMTEIYETKFPSIYNLWKIVSFGIVAYLIAIDIFHIVKGFKDPESDKVEVLDL